MPAPPANRPAAQLDVRALVLQIKRWSARAQKRGIGTRTCYIDLLRKLWDRIVLLMFTCCLFTFLHALFGLGAVHEDLRSSGPFGLPRATLSISSPWNRGPKASKGSPEIRTPGVARAMIDWHGNYELLPSTASVVVSPASIPQDGFPDPTPVLVGVGRGRALDENSPPMTTKVKMFVDAHFTFDETPYDPSRLEFEDSVDGGEVHGLYPIARPPKTAAQGARTRRFGRCLAGGACL